MANVCTVTVDPTPGVTVDYQQLVHNIHFARLREGYVERNNLVDPGTLNYLGFNNSLLELPGDPLAGRRPVLHQLPPGHQRDLLVDARPAATGRAAASPASA